MNTMNKRGNLEIATKVEAWMDETDARGGAGVSEKEALQKEQTVRIKNERIKVRYQRAALQHASSEELRWIVRGSVCTMHKSDHACMDERSRAAREG